MKTSLGTSSTERLKLRRQMTTEAGKGESVQSSLFLQVDTSLIQGHVTVDMRVQDMKKVLLNRPG